MLMSESLLYQMSGGGRVSRRRTIPALSLMQTPALDSSCRAVPAAARGGRGEPEVGAAGWVTGQRRHSLSGAEAKRCLLCALVINNLATDSFFPHNFLFFPPY